MKHKTSELTGEMLNAAASIAEGRAGPRRVPASVLRNDGVWVPIEVIAEGPPFHPATSWEHGGPIIEREHIEVAPEYTADGKLLWRARKHDEHGVFLPGHVDGSLLVAAMRCFVFRALGPAVDL